MSSETLVAPVRGASFRIKENPDVEDIILNLTANETLDLQREPTNRFDENAIRVHTTEGVFIGYIGKEFAAQIAPFMDQNATVTARAIGFSKPLEPLAEIEIQAADNAA